MYTVHVYTVLAMCTVCTVFSGARLLKRDLSGYQLAKCNDGSTAAYYHDQDVRQAGDKVLIYLPDGRDCGSVGQCRKRCKNKPFRCTAPTKPVLELNDGIWSSNITENPFADYFKIFIHYCSSDNFAGTRGSSLSTGNFYFHGKHILTATLQDLVASFGIERAGSVILAGSGSGGAGVGHSCDYVSSAMRGVNPAAEVRCLADGPDFVPWWVKTGAEQCRGRDLRKMKAEKTLWSRVDDDSCVEENKDSLNSASLAHRCGVMSRYWEDIETPLLVVASQLDPVYYEDSPCTPGVEDAQYEDYRAAWRRGVVVMAESIQASRPNRTSCFVPSCASHTLLAGRTAQVYWAGVQVQAIQGERKLTLREMVGSWLRSDYQQAVDPLGQENSQCPSPSPLKTARWTRTRTGVPRRQSVYHAQSFNRRLLPPTSLFPTTYSRKCSLDPWYGACDRRAFASVGRTSLGVGLATSHGAGIATSRGVGHATGHGAGLATSHGVGLPTVHDAVFSTRVGLDDAGRRKSLWQKLYKLQYLKQLYNKYKQSYAREYHGVDARPVVTVDTRPVVVREQTRPVIIREKSIPAIFRPKRPRVVFAPRRVPTVVAAPRRVPSVVTVERPPLVSVSDVLPSVSSPDYAYDYASVDYDYAPTDYDYGAYDYGAYDDAAYDYAEYYDYAQTQGGCDTGCAKAKLVRALKLKKKNNNKTTEVAKTGIVRDDGKLLKSFREFLAESDLDYEDFGSLSSQVEAIDKDSLKLQKEKARKKALLKL